MTPNLPSLVSRFEFFDIVMNVSGLLRRVAKVRFATDGSIYVFFPGFHRTDGIACKAKLSAHAPATSTLDLTENGKVTSHLVKYSHHPDGEAHFSQDGKVTTDIRRKSVPLESQRGHLFSIQAQRVDAFPLLQKARKRQMTFTLNSDVRALKITAWRYHLSDLGIPSDVTPSMRPGGIQGPDGTVRQGLFVLPPVGMCFDDVVLFLAVEEIPWLNEEKSPQLLFVGGFDTQQQAFDHSVDTEFLAFAYPCSDLEELKERIGSIDFVQTKTTSEALSPISEASSAGPNTIG